MKVAVITPYHDPNCPYLQQCIDSVASQTYTSIVHVTIGDGCDLPDRYKQRGLHNISLPSRLNNFGDSPRSIGVVYAFGLGVDAVLFLDSDNWFAPQHVANLVSACVESGADVVTCRRQLCHLDGRVLGVCPESDGVIFSDTNCLLVTRKLAEEAGFWWLIPDDLHVIDDRVLWDTLIHATENITVTNHVTVYYRTAFKFHYDMFQQPAPKHAKLGEEIAALGALVSNLRQRAKQRAKQIKSIA
jgi:glycosyltransferase involved in cell wall biosynthesis